VTENLLVELTAPALRFLVAHAIENTGCFGDTSVEVAIQGANLEWVWFDGPFPQRSDDPKYLQGPIRSRKTISLDSLHDSPQELLSATSILVADLVQAFGKAEVKPVASDGTIRIKYFDPQRQEAIEKWAEEAGVPVSNETLAV
jgi:hypothetical protein